MAQDNTTLDDLQPDDRNLNKHSVRGSSQLERSLRQYGAGRSILVDKDNRIIAGNLTAEMAREAGITKVQVVETDGNTLIAVKRVDLSLDSKEARELALADNRVSEVSLEWDTEELQKLSAEGLIDANAFFFDSELDRMAKQLEREQQKAERIPTVGEVNSEQDRIFEQSGGGASPPAKLDNLAEPPKYDSVEREEHYGKQPSKPEPQCQCPSCGEIFHERDLVRIR